jgi:radical SAM superfamily enzyme YgiQ (UPF0313 family)
LVDVVLIHSPTVIEAERYRKSFHAMDKMGYGMLHIASLLSKNGYGVQVWNVPELYRQGYSERFLSARLKSCSPKVVGVELNWMHQSCGAIDIARMVKKAIPGTPVVIGGTHATIFAEEIASRYSHCVDGVLRGEAELSFLDCVKRIEEDKPLDEVSGITRRSGDKLISNPVDKIIENIDDVPPYSLKGTNRDGLEILGHPDPNNYAPAINVCRGPCPRQCIYCIGPRIPEISGRREYTTHSPDWVIEQMRLLVEEGYRELYIQDWTYLSSKKTIESIAEAMIKERLNEKVEHLNLVSAPGFLERETIRKLSQAGVDTIDYGMETGSQRILNTLKRDITLQQMRDAVKAAAVEGVIPQTWWMVGFPEETWENVKETAGFIKETTDMGGLPFWITPLMVEPGTELYENAGRYELRLRMRSFGDYMQFSKTPLRRLAWYPELITHETAHFKVEDILRASFLLRMFVYRRREEILTKIKNLHERFRSEEVVSHIREASERILFTVF